MHTDREIDDDRIDWRLFWNTIFRRKWAILSLASIASVLTAIVVFSMTPMYSAVALVHIQSEQPNIVSIEEIYGVDTRRGDYYETQAEIMKSRPIAAKVVDAMGPPTTVDSSGFPSFDFDLRDLLPFTAPEPPGGSVDANLYDYDIDDYLDGLWVNPVRNTQLVEVGYVSADPREAAAYANAHAAAYIESILDARLAVTQSASSWMGKRVEELRENLQDSEARLQAFREQERLIDVQGFQALPNLEVNDLSARLVDARRRLSATKIAYLQVYGSESGAIESVPAVLENDTVQQFRAIQALAEQAVAELGKRYGPKHPRMIAAQSELAEATQNLESQQRDVAGGIQAEYLAAQAEVATLEAELSDAKQQYQEITRKGSRLASLQREVETNRELFDLFYSRMRETAQTGDLDSVNARIVEPAIVPRFAFKPDRKRAVVIAFILSLLAGMGAAVLLEKLNNTIRNADDAERKIGLPLLGSVPVLRKKTGQPPGPALLDEAETRFAEAIRSIRTGVSLSNRDDTHQVILVTSSVGSEGKSTLALNLALSFSRTERVLLLDGDFRRPSVADELQLEDTRPGLSELLLQHADVEDCIVRLEDYNLDVLATGALPPDPLQVLSSNSVDGVMKLLRGIYDRIIIDSPPILPVTDAAVLSKHADALLYVIKSDSTSAREVSNGLDQLRRFDAPIAGVVLNQVDLRKAGRFGVFRYNDGYYENSARGTDRMKSATGASL